jgi:hypothetical protein
MSRPPPPIPILGNQDAYGPKHFTADKPSLAARFMQPFAWRTVFDAGCYTYQINSLTQQRRAIRFCHGYSPIDYKWLNDVA